MNCANPALLDRCVSDSPSEGIGCCGYVLMGLSYLLILITFPFSLCLCIKVSCVEQHFAKWFVGIVAVAFVWMHVNK